MTKTKVQKPLTTAEAARYIARIEKIAVTAMAELAQGMWNQYFCSAECSAWALSICEDLRSQLDQLEKRATRGDHDAVHQPK